MTITLAPLEAILQSPTSGFARLTNQPAHMKQQLGEALRASGLIEATGLIARKFGTNTDSNASTPGMESSHFCPPRGEAGLAYSVYRWNEEGKGPHATGNYREEIDIFQHDADGRRMALLNACVIKSDAPNWDDAGKLTCTLDGANLAGLKRALPVIQATLDMASDKKSGAKPAATKPGRISLQ